MTFFWLNNLIEGRLPVSPTKVQKPKNGNFITTFFVGTLRKYRCLK